MVGGLFFSQIITLYITPVVYTYMDAFQKRLSRRSEAPARAASVPAEVAG